MKKTATLLILFFSLTSINAFAQQPSSFEKTMKFEAISANSHNKGLGYYFVFDIGDNKVSNYYSFILLNKSKIINAKEIKCIVKDTNNQVHEVMITNDTEHVIPNPIAKIDLVAIPVVFIEMALNKEIQLKAVFDTEEHLEKTFNELTPEDILIFKKRLKEFVKKQTKSQ